MNTLILILFCVAIAYGIIKIIVGDDDEDE